MVRLKWLVEQLHSIFIRQFQSLLGVQITHSPIPVAVHQNLSQYLMLHLQVWFSLGTPEQLACNLVHSLNQAGYFTNTEIHIFFTGTLQNHVQSQFPQANEPHNGAETLHSEELVSEEVTTQDSSNSPASFYDLGQILNSLEANDSSLIQIMATLLERKQFRLLVRIIENFISNSFYARRNSLTSLLNQFGLVIADRHFPDNIDTSSKLDVYFSALSLLAPVHEISQSLFYFLRLHLCLFMPYRCQPFKSFPQRRPPSDDDQGASGEGGSVTAV